jgi:thioredoxin 1
MPSVAKFLQVSLLCGGVAFSCLPSQLAQASQKESSSFEPLNQWKAAVLSGDRSVLAGFYAAGGRASAGMPSGRRMDPEVEEPDFWITLQSKGLVEVAPKILEETRPLDGVRLFLYIKLTFRDDSKLLVSAEQIWVKESGVWKILITNRSDPGPMPTHGLPEPKTLNPYLYPDPAVTQNDMDAALASAKIDRKRVLAIFGANWCYECHVLDAALHSTQIEAFVAANYHVVHVNIGDGDANAALALRYQVPLDKGVPALAVIDSNGDLLTSPGQGGIQSAAQVGMSDLVSFLTQWKR